MAGCGSCNACCTLIAVHDIFKPAGMRCWDTGPHGGCKRQAEKASAPELQACATWECVWRNTQDEADSSEHLPRALRPDICHVMVGPADTISSELIAVHVDPRFPDAWRKPGIADWLRMKIANGAVFQVHIDETIFMLENGGI